MELAAESDRGKRQLDYAGGNSCLIFGPDTPTTNTHNPLAIPNVLYVVITKNLTSRVYLTSCSALSSDHLPVLIETTCRSSFQHPPDRPNFSPTDRAKFQTHFEDQIAFHPELHDGMAIDNLVEYFFRAVLGALAASTHKRRPRADPRPLIPAGIQVEIRMKNRLRRQWQVTRDPTLRAEFNRLQRSVTRRLNDPRNGQWIGTLESLDPKDQSLWRVTKWLITVSTPSPPGHPGWESLSDSEKADALADTLETQFQPVAEPSVPQVLRWFTWR